MEDGTVTKSISGWEGSMLFAASSPDGLLLAVDHGRDIRVFNRQTEQFSLLKGHEDETVSG